jgi:hypothetical protein
MSLQQNQFNNMPPRRPTPVAFSGNKPNVFCSPPQSNATTPQPAAPSSTEIKQLVKKLVRKPRRNLKKEIIDKLDKGIAPGQIIEDLQCQPQAVYYHVNKRKGNKKIDGNQVIKAKLARFNRKFFKDGGYKMNLSDLEAATNGFICAFSGRKIDLNKDVFCLTMNDGLPTVYLAEYHTLLKLLKSGKYQENCITFLKSKGFKVEDQRVNPME